MPIATQSPPVGYSSTGITTIVWGTQGLAVFAGDAGPDIYRANNGYYIVLNYRQRLDQDVDYGETASGVKCWRRTVIHGMVWEIEVEDNDNMIPPVNNTVIECYDILTKGSGVSGSVGFLQWIATVVESEYTAAPNKPGVRRLTAENLRLVDNYKLPG